MATLQKCIVVLAGLPLSGKSTIGNKLSALFDAPFLDIDKTRQEIAPGTDWLGPDKEKEIMLSAYELNHKKAAQILRQNRAVILAATYSRESYHEMVSTLSKETNSPLYVFLLQTPEEAIKLRIAERQKADSNSLSNITDMAGYSEVRDRYMPFQGMEVSIMNTAQSVDAVVSEISQKLPILS